MRTQKQTFELRLDYLTDSDRDDQTFTFDLSELPEDRMIPLHGVPSEVPLGVFYEWEKARGGSTLKVCMNAPHIAGADALRLTNRKLTVVISTELVFSFISRALEQGQVSIGSQDAGKLLVAIGNALQRQGDDQ